MMKAIQIREYGTPDVLHWQEIDEPTALGANEAQVRLAVAGLNYIDVYRRSGEYPEDLPLPLILGQEGAGVVESVGAEVTTVKVGDRVAYCNVLGSYAEVSNVPADQLIPLPNDVSFEQGAAFPLQGMTAHYLIHDYVALQPGKTMLVHAAAGGVGLLVVQWAKHLGAKVIGTVSTQEKAQVARAAGADEVILYTEQDFVAETKRLTAGRGADLVLDGVGQSTFAGSLEATAMHGTVVSYGWSSGLPESVAPISLIVRSLKVGGGNLVNATTTRELLLQRANGVLEGIRAGWLDLRIDSILPLYDAAEAHRRLESRTSMGKILLTIR
ncbi:MAG: quinone oxidoreductase [Oculatellaceae cyanobacterium bins.114]|nr:quinone oxidoreductase [Oculatellaceae cyanobacterium bins.114]